MEDILLLNNGMHSDNDPIQQPPNSYRDALNGNLISIGENRYSFESIKGTTQSFTLPTHLAPTSISELPFQIIGWYSFLDELIVLIGNNQTSSYLPGEIGRVVFNNSGTGTYSSIYYHQNLNFSKFHPISHDAIVGKHENSNIRRLFWTDNNAPMRSINLYDKRLTTNYTPGRLVNGNTYMVLSNNKFARIVYNNISYGAGSLWSGGALQNIFTANATTTYTAIGSVRVIDYIDLQEISVSADFSPGNIYFKKRIIGGSLLAGTYQYAYQLEAKDGSFTNWSPLSTSMYNPNSLTASALYSAFVGQSAGTVTNQCILFDINNINTSIYVNIKIAFVFSEQKGVYTNPKIFYYGATSSSMSITHYGNEISYGTVDLNTLTISSQTFDLVKTITSTKNILFAGNIGLSNDPLINLSQSVTAKTIKHYIPSDNVTSYTNNNQGSEALFGMLGVGDEGVGNTYAYPTQWYESTGTDIGTNYVLYNGIKYYVGGANGAYFLGISGKTVIDQKGTAFAYPVIRIQQYAGTYTYHRILADYLDYKGITRSIYSKGYWRDETYRFGIFFYGKKGQQNFVTWLIDKKFPKQWNNGTVNNEYIKNDDTTTTTVGFDCGLLETQSSTTLLKALGLDFSNIDFNVVAKAYGCSLVDLNNYVSGFSIVRCERDKQILHQGMIWPNVFDGSATRILSTNSLANDNYYAVDPVKGRSKNSYMYYSPDNLIGYDDTIKEGDKIEISDQYRDNSGGSVESLVSSDSSNFGYISKYYTLDRQVGTYYQPGEEVKLHITGCVNVYEFTDSAIPFVGTFINKSKSAGFSSIGGLNTLGAKGLHVYVDKDEAIYSRGFGLVDTPDTSGGSGYGRTRSLVNWKRINNNLYGGTSDIAKATNKYISTGHYQLLDAAFMAYMTGNAGIVNNIEVYGGDCFLSIFGYARTFNDYEGSSKNGQFGNGFAIPIECNVNENWRGDMTGVSSRLNSNANSITTLNNNRFKVSTNAKGIYGDLNYSYNLESSINYEAYSGNEKEYYFVARPFNFVSNARDEQLILRSLIKINGETNDNWKVFLSNNQIRVDSQFGPINNIRSKGSKLFYWQSKGVGYIPILERQMDSGLLGGAIQMGVGGIMERFDEVDYYYGNQHQMSLMENESSFTWFDFRRRSVMSMTMNGQSVQISELKGLSNHFHTFFQALETSATTTSIFNTDSPLDEKGIVSYYDPRFKLGLICFKVDSTLYGGTNLNFTIGLNSHLNKFVGFFNIDMNHAISHNGHLLLTHLSGKSIFNSTAYAVGDQISYLGINFVCILAYTSGNPAINPLTDSTHWMSTMSVDEVHVGWRGTVCYVFNKSRDFYLTIILKSRDLTNISVDNVEVAGNNTPFTDIFIKNQSGSASDTNLTKTDLSTLAVSNKSKNHKYYDGSWWFSLPMKNKNSRLIDHYVELKMQIKYVFIDINLMTKRISYIKYFFRKKL